MINSSSASICFHILGAGSIGSALASRLHDENFKGIRLYSLSSRSGNKRIIYDFEQKRSEILVHKLDTSKTIVDDKDIVIFCLRTPQLKTWLKEPRRLNFIPKACTVLFISNGMILDEIQEFQKNIRPDLNIALGLAYFGSTEQTPNTYQIMSKKLKLEISWVDQGKSNRYFEKIFLPEEATWHNDLLPKMVEKWIFNCIANSLSLAFKLSKNKELETHKKLVDELFHELIVFSKTRWTNLNFLKGYQNNQQLSTKFWNLIEQTSENQNSMLAHYKKNLSSEHQDLLGYIFSNPDPKEAEKYPKAYKLYCELENLLSTEQN